jgi:hypothetical protein
LASPTAAPTSSATAIATATLCPPTSHVQATAPVKETVEPTERSNSPIAMHSVMAKPGIAMMLAATTTFSRFVPDRKRSVVNASTTTTMSSGMASGAAVSADCSRWAPVTRVSCDGRSMVVMPAPRSAVRSWRRR